MTKRFGEIPSTVEGVDGQLLRVKEDGTGFEFTDPATIPEYTVTNPVVDRAFNVADTDIDELAAVLGTLIADLEAAGLTGGSAGLEAFQWSTSEQVWPFEKDSDGNTLYAKEVDFGSFPSNGLKQVAHNISGVSGGNIYDMRMLGKNTVQANHPIQSPDSGWRGFYVYDDHIAVQTTNSGWNVFSGKVRLIYNKV